MNLYVGALLASVVCSAASIGSFFYLKKRLTASDKPTYDALCAQIEEHTVGLKDLLQYTESYGSRAQFESIASQATTLQSDLEREKQQLSEIESRLDVAQKSVEEKEAQQQEVKSAKEDEESRIHELMARHADLSAESMALEQRLATSMKNLDSLMSQVELTQSQRAMVDQISKALSDSGERMRDLLTEYESVHNRVSMLQQQHQDLEDEYTKLVEQQLGD